MITADKRRLGKFHLTSVEWVSLRRIVLIVSTLIAMFVAGGYAYSEFQAQRNLAENRLTRLNEYADLAALSIHALDYDSVERSSRFLTDDPNILSITVIDHFGYQVVGDRERTLAFRDSGAEIVSFPLLIPARFDQGNREVGHIYFAVELSDFEGLVWATLVRGGLAFLLTLSVLALALYTYIARNVTRPALDVVEAIMDTTRTGTPAPARVMKGSQIGQLALYFNKMQERLLASLQEQHMLAEELQTSVKSLKREQENNRLQLQALNEALQSSGQSLIYFDADGRAVFSNTNSLHSEVMRGAMALAAWGPEQLATYLEDQGASLSHSPRSSDTCIVASEVTTADGRIWSLSASELERGAVGVICSDISDRRAIEDQIVQGQKMEGLGMLASGVAHEFNNILAIVMGNLELLEMQDNLPANADKIIASGKRSVERASNITRSLLAFSRRRNSARVQFSVSDAVRELDPMFRGSLPPSVKFHLDLRSNATIVADKSLFETAAVNLVNNACEAILGTGDIWFTLYDEMPSNAAATADASPEYIVVLDVEDNGPGVDPNKLKNIFDPFFTTKMGRGGTGLGLSLVYSFANECGGSIVYSRTAENRSRFQMRLPSGRLDQSDTTKRTTPRERAKISNVPILLIEDEPELLTLMKTVLTLRGFTILTAESVAEAKTVLLNGPGSSPLRLVLSDYSLPDGTALDVLDIISENKLDLPVVLVSGNMSIDAVDILRFRDRIQKPVHFDELEKVILNLLRSSELLPA